MGPLLDASENWMYGEGEERDLVSYQEHLKDLQDKVSPLLPAGLIEAKRQHTTHRVIAWGESAARENPIVCVEGSRTVP